VRWHDLLAGVQRRVPWGVALTFDGGPTPSTTPALLDLLRTLDVRASFFMAAGAVRACPDLVLRMQEEGHGVGTSAAPSPDAIEDAMVALQLVLDRRVRTFRPVGDAIDRHGALALRRARADVVLWSIDGEPSSVDDRDVIRLDVDVAHDVVRRTVALVRANDLDFVAL
jgi:peptidoglycan/xylan/chitin deacetylase (PgdA/CDA1 family)